MIIQKQLQFEVNKFKWNNCSTTLCPTVCGGVVQVMTHWCPPVTVPGATAVVTTVCELPDLVTGFV